LFFEDPKEVIAILHSEKLVHLDSVTLPLAFCCRHRWSSTAERRGFIVIDDFHAHMAKSSVWKGRPTASTHAMVRRYTTVGPLEKPYDTVRRVQRWNCREVKWSRRGIDRCANLPLVGAPSSSLQGSERQ